MPHRYADGVRRQMTVENLDRVVLNLHIVATRTASALIEIASAVAQAGHRAIPDRVEIDTLLSVGADVDS